MCLRDCKDQPVCRRTLRCQQTLKDYLKVLKELCCVSEIGKKTNTFSSKLCIIKCNFISSFFTLSCEYMLFYCSNKEDLVYKAVFVRPCRWPKRLLHHAFAAWDCYCSCVSLSHMRNLGIIEIARSK